VETLILDEGRDPAWISVVVDEALLDDLNGRNEGSVR